MAAAEKKKAEEVQELTSRETPDASMLTRRITPPDEPSLAMAIDTARTTNWHFFLGGGGCDGRERAAENAGRRARTFFCRF